MGKRANEMTTREAADALGVHIDTVVRWAKEAVAAARAELGASNLQVAKVRIECTRKVPRYYLDAAEVKALASREPGELF